MPLISAQTSGSKVKDDASALVLSFEKVYCHSFPALVSYRNDTDEHTSVTSSLSSVALIEFRNKLYPLVIYPLRNLSHQSIDILKLVQSSQLFNFKILFF